MVGLIILGLCILGSVALICFKGIQVTYRKNFTVRDERYEQAKLTDEQVKVIEKDLNKPKENKQDGEDLEFIGPMDGVIETVQELFGPEKKE